MKRKAIVCALMALLTVCLPPTALASEAVQVKNVTITPNDTASNTTIIYYGGHDWYVIENGTNALTLFSKNLIYGTKYTWLSKSDNGTANTGMRYGESNSGTKFTGSKMEKALNDVLDMDFSEYEKAAITRESWQESGKSVSAVIWPLDYNKWGNPDQGASYNGGKLNQQLRKAYADRTDKGDHWWFRTPGGNSTIWFADGGGDFYAWGNPQGNESYSYYGMRPAFNLNLDKVLFFSDANGGKTTDAVSFELALHKTDTNKYKATILDDTRNAFSASLTSITNNTSVNLSYSNATHGEKEFLSAIIKDEDDVTYYGRIKALTAAGDASGTATVNIPNGVTLDGDTKLYVFNEHYNGNISTGTVNGYDANCIADYASPLVGFNIYSFQATANGSDTEKTTQLTLAFDPDVTGLTAADITVTGATKGTLTKVNGKTGEYTLAISDITVGDGENVTVVVTKSGYTIAPASRNVAVRVPTDCVFTNLTANGSDTEKTTQLTLTFDRDVAGLTAADITVTGATKGTLTKVNGKTGEYTLAISDITVGDGGNVNVAVTKSGYTITPANRDVAVHVPTDCAFTNLTANGSATEKTTQLTLIFDRDVAGLTAADITVTGATKGTLTKVNGKTGEYTLAISDITVGDGGNVNVAVTKSGYTITPASRNVAVQLFTPNIPRTGDDRPIEEAALLLLLSLFGIALALCTVRRRRKL